MAFIGAQRGGVRGSFNGSGRLGAAWARHDRAGRLLICRRRATFATSVAATAVRAIGGWRSTPADKRTSPRSTYKNESRM